MTVYIEEKEIDDNNYAYSFVNNKYTYGYMYCPVPVKDYSRYYINQSYKGFCTDGYFVINHDGNMCEEGGILDNNTLAELDIICNIDKLEAVNMVNGSGKYSNILEVVSLLKKIEDGYYVPCYYFLFDDNTSVYLDAKSGEIVE